MKSMLALSLLLLVVEILPPSTPVFAANPTLLKVGYGDFPPIFIDTPEGPTGFWVDLIELLNTIQKEYKFVLDPIPPARRFIFLESHHVDLMANENPGFGWAQGTTAFSTSLYSVSDRFIALRETAKKQRYFSDLREKRIRCLIGFHYNFEKKYKSVKPPLMIERTSSNNGNLHALLYKRAEIVVISEIYLPQFLTDNPTIKDKFLMSTTADGRYAMSFAMTKQNPKINLKALNSYLRQIEKSGALRRLRKKYKLPRH